MSAPLFTVTDASSATINSISYQNVNAGSSGSVVPLLFWNNYNGSSVLPDAVQVSITAKTFSGLDSGDTVANGQEVVTDTMLNIKCTTQGDSGYTAVGGPTTAPIGDGTAGPGTISGKVGGSYAYVDTYIAAPNGVSAGPAAFLVLLNYLYS